MTFLSDTLRSALVSRGGMELETSRRCGSLIGSNGRDPGRRMSQQGLVRIALNNAYLKEQGLPELREIWIRLHYGDQPKSKGKSKLVT